MTSQFAFKRESQVLISCAGQLSHLASIKKQHLKQISIADCFFKLKNLQTAILHSNAVKKIWHVYAQHPLSLFLSLTQSSNKHKLTHTHTQMLTHTLTHAHTHTHTHTHTHAHARIHVVCIIQGRLFYPHLRPNERGINKRCKKFFSLQQNDFFCSKQRNAAEEVELFNNGVDNNRVEL